MTPRPPLPEDEADLVRTLGELHSLSTPAVERLDHLTRLILAAAGEGIFGVDPEGRATFLNPAAARMLGYRPEELAGRVLHELIHHTRPDGSPYLWEDCPIHAALQDGTVRQVTECVFWRKDGSSFPVEYISTPIREEGRVVGAVCTFDDITVRRRAEEASQQLAAIVESSEDGIIGITLDGVITSWNAGAERLYGYAAQEIVGRSVSVLIPPDRLDELPRNLERVRRGERIEQFEMQRVRKDGGRVEVSLSLSPIRDAAGQIVGAASIARDITERKRAEAERARLNSALAERERHLQELVRRLILAQEEERRRVAYELHDGLAQTAAGAHMYLRGFVRRYQAHLPEGREELDQALELAQRVVREARGVVAGLRPTALDDFGLEAALRLEVDGLKNSGLDAEFEAALGPERLELVIETALFRVAQEALKNVRKHAGAQRVRVALRRTQRAVHLEVQDWGRGFRMAAAQAGAGPGKPLGLSGMREWMALLGGQCEVRSRPGVGTRIVVAVPLRPAPGPVDAAPARPRRREARKEADAPCPAC
jgi:PAS domain S-box-containing protein